VIPKSDFDEVVEGFWRESKTTKIEHEKDG
jgi:hypothetical protein